MYNQTDLQFLGKHDYDKESAIFQATEFPEGNFSINIFPLGMYTNGNKLKQLKGVVRIHGKGTKIDKMIKMAELVVSQLDANEWDGRKNVFIS